MYVNVCMCVCMYNILHPPPNMWHPFNFTFTFTFIFTFNLHGGHSHIFSSSTPSLPPAGELIHYNFDLMEEFCIDR